MRKVSDRIADGEARPDDVALLESIAYQIDGRTICAFGEASAWPVEAIIAKYRDELIAETSEENNPASDEQLLREQMLIKK